MLKWLLLSTALLLSVASFAYATIPDSDGVIHGCYKSSGGPPATLLHGSHVTSVSRRNGGPVGAYEVFFDQDITQCSYLATMNTSGGTRGFITAALTDSPTGVIVQTANSADILADRAFSVAVFC